MGLLRYHVRLAARSLARNPVVSLIMLLALALGNGTWAIAVAQYVRFRAWDLHLSPTLHHVEVLRPRDANALYADGASGSPYLAHTSILGRNQHSWGETRRLAGSRVPVRRSDGVRSEVLVRGPDAPHPTARMARFTNAEFFSMFERPFGSGGPWPAAADAGGAGVVVLGFATGRALFPRGGAVGQTVFIEGRPFRVAGVLATYQPVNAPWQLLLLGGVEDALFLPAGELDALGAYPDQAVPETAYGVGRAAVFASDARFVSSWVDLPTPAHVAAYRADLDRLIGPGRWRLRALDEWRREFRMPSSQIAFFSFLGVVVLMGGASNLSRWLLTKGLTRSEELGIFRALGAPRAAIFTRTLAEGLLLALPAALLAPLMGAPTLWLFNRYVRVVDMPLEQSALTLAFGVFPPLFAYTLASLYPAWRLSRTPPTLHLGRP
jgi:putative ABC transport system permease protein